MNAKIYKVIIFLGILFSNPIFSQTYLTKKDPALSLPAGVVPSIISDDGTNIKIGTTVSQSVFTLKTNTNLHGFSHTDDIRTLSTYVGLFGGADGGWIGTKTNHDLHFLLIIVYQN
ncbi:MAG: hypothetical protein IPO63_13115 [Bacteroidetes bacterium]|nr:hypothetical protein [Bacteroidota bacterium]